MRLHVSVCLSVRPSVTFRYRDHIGWNSSKIISRPNSLRPMRSLTPTWAIWCNENTPKIRVEYGWGQEHIKRAVQLRNGARQDQGYYYGLRSSQPKGKQKPTKNYGENGAWAGENRAWAYTGTAQFFGYPLLSLEQVKLRTSNLASTFTGSMTVHRNKSPLKILQKESGGVWRECPNFLCTLYYLRNGQSYELQILYAYSQDRSEQKPIKIFGKSSHGCTQGLSKICRAPMYRAHRAVIFAIAQLSCFNMFTTERPAFQQQ